MIPCQCPHCHATLDPDTVRKLSGAIISTGMRKKREAREQNPEELFAFRYGILQRRAKKSKAPGTWCFEVWEGKKSHDLRIGSYTTFEDCTKECQRLRKFFTEFTFIVFGPDGSVWLPKPGNTPSGIQYKRMPLPQNIPSAGTAGDGTKNL